MLQRTMLRAFVPNSELTPVHYDQMYLRAGPPTSLTAWCPIGDISLEGGGLMYLDRSLDIGTSTEEEFSRNAGNLTDEEHISAFNKNMNGGAFLSRGTRIQRYRAPASRGTRASRLLLKTSPFSRRHSQ